MKACDEKHLRLLTLISVGDWHAIVVPDLDVLRALAVSGYIQISSARHERHQISLLPKGQSYLRRLQQLKQSSSAADASGWTDQGRAFDRGRHHAAQKR